MFGKSAGEIMGRGLAAITADVSREKSKVGAVFKRIAAYPFKILASYLAAPFLVFRVARKVENPIRRGIAIVGLLLSLVASYIADTLLGTLVGAALLRPT